VIVIPAVDLRDGRCVRLREGRSDRETVFSDDPVAMAQRWVTQGATRLHVVDLDGAFAGAPRQAALVGKIVAAVAPVVVEVGGGLREPASVEAALETGARWAVIGTRAALDAAFLRDVCRRHPGRIIVAVDARGPRVAVKGWTEVSDQTVVEVGARARDAGAAALLYTDISRDGMEQGPNVDDTAALTRAVDLPILASGGVAGLDDLRRLATIPGIEGTVVGRALYTGAIDLTVAIATLRPLSMKSGGRTEPERPSGRPPTPVASSRPPRQ
jgi:phosphoribosylformimino-5-aminoimidazole carboxamide ribotide isomerase